MYVLDAVILEMGELCLCVFVSLPRPFRRVTDRGALLWDRIHKLEKGQIYKQVLRHEIDTITASYKLLVYTWCKTHGLFYVSV